MKDIFLKSIAALIIMAGLGQASCKKNDDSPAPSTPSGNTGITAVPPAFTQKVLVEQFTGAWNGGCPDGIYKMDQLISANTGKTIGVNIHMGDAMEIGLFNDHIATFNNDNLPQFPSAMVNRLPSLGNVILTKTQWASNNTVNLSKTALCGLAIESKVTGNSASIEIHAGFKSSISTACNLTVYLIENEVTGSGSMYDQVNTNSSNDPNSPYYNKPTPITGFEHNHIVRKVISAYPGDPIDAAFRVPGGQFTKTYILDVTGKDISRLRIVAFINKPGTTPVTHEVLNVQSAALNTLKNWD